MDFILAEKARQLSMSPVQITNSDVEQLSSSSTTTSWAFRKGLTCTVCGAPAIGFNFSVITCMCCKAFFRRNALYGLQALKCRYLTQQCQVTLRTRRDCSYCRLKKCFEVGMKKELILTDDVKRKKREKLYVNRQFTIATTHPSSLMLSPANFSTSLTSVNVKNSVLLSNIFNAYEEYCRSPIVTYENRELQTLRQQPPKSRIKMQHYYKMYYTYSASLLDFFKRIPEFQQLSSEEQVALSTHNLRFLLRVNSLDILSEDCLILTGVRLLLDSLYGKPLMEAFNQHLLTFKSHLIHPLCNRILLIILLFSTYPTYHGNIRPVTLFKIQEYYTEILWSHLQENVGEQTAQQLIMAIVRDCLRLQNIGHELEQIRHDQDFDGLNATLSNSLKIA